MARDRRHARRGARQGRVATSAYVRNTAYDASKRNRQFQVVKRNTKVALRGIHVACLLIMFYDGRLAMPSLRRENVRHATLLFRAEGDGPW